MIQSQRQGKAAFAALAKRDMSDPTRQGQPKHMKNFKKATPPYDESNNNGWVHVNSGIHNYAAYKIMTSKIGGKYLFTRRQLAAIFYIALTPSFENVTVFR